MPPLTAEFRQHVADAIGLVHAAELARSQARHRSVTWRALHFTRLQILYEIAFLRIFVAWESFLEATFHRYLCGYVSHVGQAQLLPTQVYSPTIGAAEQRVLGNQQYVLWHNPNKVIARSGLYFVGAPHQVVIGSNLARLEAMANVRHRVAHAHKDARAKFDGATTLFVGRRYPGSRPGAFLRDEDNTQTPPTRWLEILGTELSAIAVQVA